MISYYTTNVEIEKLIPFFFTMAPAASAASAKSMRAHCTQADGSKPQPNPGENTVTKQAQSPHQRDSYVNEHTQAAKTAAAEGAEEESEEAAQTTALRSPSASPSLNCTKK
jgi:hypothetical protein